MTLEDVTIFFYFMTFIPKSHILAKKVDFLKKKLHVSAILEEFLTELERKNKTKKLHMTFDDLVELTGYPIIKRGCY